MDKPKNIPGYVYCSLCDIYYPKKLFDKAEEEKAKRLKSKDEHIRRMTFNLTGCPMCRSKIRETLASLSLSIRSGDFHRLTRRSSLGHRTVQSGKTPKKYIFVEKIKK